MHTQPCEDGMGGDRYENVLPVPASNVGFLNADAPFVWVDFTPQVGALGESIPVIFRTYPLDAARAKSMVITLKDSTQKLACTNLSF